MEVKFADTRWGILTEAGCGGPADSHVTNVVMTRAPDQRLGLRDLAFRQSIDPAPTSSLS
jgi:phosphoglucomutase